MKERDVDLLAAETRESAKMVTGAIGDLAKAIEFLGECVREFALIVQDKDFGGAEE